MELRVDKEKLLRHVRRPFPHGGQDIGSWELALSIISNFAICTNSLLITFTTKAVLGKKSFAYRLFVFIVVEHALFGAKFVFLSVFMPEVRAASSKLELM